MEKKINNQYEFAVDLQRVDFQTTLKLSMLGDLLLTASGKNADENGFGFKDLQKNNVTWVLIRFAIEMKRYPLQYEKIRIKTWVEDVSRAFTTRNFTITDEQGEIIGSAASNWAALDIETRKPIDLSLLAGLKEKATNEPGLIDRPARLGKVNTEPADSFTVRYNDIDINQHVNSIRYIQWITNLFPLDTFREKYVQRFDINYMDEAVFGDKIDICYEEKAEDEFLVEIMSNGNTSCRARLVWKMRVE
ncbi:MAG: acyl-[acyl-carrier-protein] thioesterase [Prevotellaceae bacterium]|jgi:acyl-ACP thioesterase|nr:acyl-[acyl-carrier-protein] thioesterase [Prevotellaceae bacterium]